MASLTERAESVADRALLRADDLRSKVVEETVDELTGQSKRKWALVLTAFLAGAAVAVMVIALSRRRAAETNGDSDADSVATGPALARTGETPVKSHEFADLERRARWWDPRARHARAPWSPKPNHRLPAPWSFPKRP